MGQIAQFRVLDPHQPATDSAITKNKVSLNQRHKSKRGQKLKHCLEDGSKHRIFNALNILTDLKGPKKK